MARKLEVELNAKSNADVMFGRASRAASQFGRELTNRVMGAVAPMMLLDKGLELVKGGLDKYADANARARKMGVGFADFYKLSQALEDTGVSEETTAKAMKEMSVLLAEAQGGAEAQTKALMDLGYSQEQIKGGTIDVIDLFMKLADATKAARTEAERNNLVLTVLGKKTGPELQQALSAGSQELRKNMGSAANVTDDMGQRAEDARNFFRQMGDSATEAGMNLYKYAADIWNLSTRFEILNESMKTVTQGKLDDEEATKVLARTLIQLGEANGMSADQMVKDLQKVNGELGSLYALAQDSSKTIPLFFTTPEDAETGKRIMNDVLKKAREMAEAKKQINKSETKPTFAQFGATSMQALGGGYALGSKTGAALNNPPMAGTTPLLPGSLPTAPTTVDQLLNDIRSMVNTINGKIETPSSNQTNPHFRL